MKNLNVIGIGEEVFRPFELCYHVALKGIGQVSPNPMVGAVVLDSNNKLLGYGSHDRYGGPHAEVGAIKMALKQLKNLGGSKIYVTLQPCSHFGKTPPCEKLISEHGIKEVHYLLNDPNPKIKPPPKHYKKHGGRESELYKNLISPFLFSFRNHTRPYVAVKTATSLNGFVGERGDKRRWVTNEKSRQYGHVLRQLYDGVVVGRKTVELDLPNLSPRLEFINCRIPWRIIIDPGLKTLASQKGLPSEVREKTIFVHNQNHKPSGFHSVIINNEGLSGVLQELRLNFQIQSLLIEGGATSHKTFFDQGVVDRVFHFKSGLNIDSKNAIPWYQSQAAFNFELVNKVENEGDTLCEYSKNENP